MPRRFQVATQGAPQAETPVSGYGGVGAAVGDIIGSKLETQRDNWQIEDEQIQADFLKGEGGGFDRYMALAGDARSVDDPLAAAMFEQKAHSLKGSSGGGGGGGRGRGRGRGLSKSDKSAINSAFDGSMDEIYKLTKVIFSKTSDAWKAMQRNEISGAEFAAIDAGNEAMALNVMKEFLNSPLAQEKKGVSMSQFLSASNAMLSVVGGSMDQDAYADVVGGKLTNKTTWKDIRYQGMEEDLAVSGDSKSKEKVLMEYRKLLTGQSQSDIANFIADQSIKDILSDIDGTKEIDVQPFTQVNDAITRVQDPNDPTRWMIMPTAQAEQMMYNQDNGEQNLTPVQFRTGSGALVTRYFNIQTDPEDIDTQFITVADRTDSSKNQYIPLQETEGVNPFTGENITTLIPVSERTDSSGQVLTGTGVNWIPFDQDAGYIQSQTQQFEQPPEKPSIFGAPQVETDREIVGAQVGGLAPRGFGDILATQQQEIPQEIPGTQGSQMGDLFSGGATDIEQQRAEEERLKQEAALQERMRGASAGAGFDQVLSDSNTQARERGSFLQGASPRQRLNRPSPGVQSRQPSFRSLRRRNAFAGGAGSFWGNVQNAALGGFSNFRNMFRGWF